MHEGSSKPSAWPVDADDTQGDVLFDAFGYDIQASNRKFSLLSSIQKRLSVYTYSSWVNGMANGKLEVLIMV